MILDEPTVGVDPLLRQRIWMHLVQMSMEQDKTILITTHYIEEARQANTVGMMRTGRLLAEDSPVKLLAKYEKDTLEEVFMKLCMREEIQELQVPAIDEVIDQVNQHTCCPRRV